MAPFGLGHECWLRSDDLNLLERADAAPGMEPFIHSEFFCFGYLHTRYIYLDTYAVVDTGSSARTVIITSQRVHNQRKITVYRFLNVNVEGGGGGGCCALRAWVRGYYRNRYRRKTFNWH